jgi:hypothetical protein
VGFSGSGPGVNDTFSVVGQMRRLALERKGPLGLQIPHLFEWAKFFKIYSICSVLLIID